jgi:hypothetical protein
MTQHILLLGAGFSRNWGGWLADEAFEYLLGHPRIDDGLRTLLWRHKGKGGFEAAVDEQQTQTAQETEGDKALRTSMMGGVVSNTAMLDHAQRLDEAIRGMFADMNKAFATVNFEFQNSIDYSVRSCLVRFDAIFTLNQDVLMEQHYLTSSFVAASRGRWNGWQIPGMEPIPPEGVQPHEMNWVPMDASEFVLREKCQPYFKLRGSSTWIDDRSGREMLIIGGDKPSAIERHPILKWNHEQFRVYLSKPETRLMVIGYSFRDEHINNAIGEAAERGSLRLFIIDPDGVDVLDKDYRKSLFWESSDFRGPLLLRFQNHLIGASRRTLREIFGGDMVEHGKVMRFFA